MKMIKNTIYNSPGKIQDFCKNKDNKMLIHKILGTSSKQFESMTSKSQTLLPNYNLINYNILHHLILFFKFRIIFVSPETKVAER